MGLSRPDDTLVNANNCEPWRKDTTVPFSANLDLERATKKLRGKSDQREHLQKLKYGRPTTHSLQYSVPPKNKPASCIDGRGAYCVCFDWRLSRRMGGPVLTGMCSPIPSSQARQVERGKHMPQALITRSVNRQDQPRVRPWKLWKKMLTSFGDAGNGVSAVSSDQRMNYPMPPGLVTSIFTC
ncbi:hypothetical protein VTI74DRAFT_357 [Chaetomium olivicolor]